MLGFAVIMLIPIDIVRELGITASLGVAWMIITNKMLLPILLSHLHMRRRAATKEAYQESRVERIWHAASGCVDRRKADARSWPPRAVDPRRRRAAARTG